MYKGETVRSPPLLPSRHKNKGRRTLVAVGMILGLAVLVAGVPIFLQLRSSSLLEARLAFVKRLLAEAPLVEGYFSPRMDGNFSVSISEVSDNSVGAVLWSIPVPCGAQYLDGVQLALEGIDHSRRQAEADNLLKLVESADEMEMAHNQVRIRENNPTMRLIC